jgi:hypothetical protein
VTAATDCATANAFKLDGDTTVDVDDVNGGLLGVVGVLAVPAVVDTAVIVGVVPVATRRRFVASSVAITLLVGVVVAEFAVRRLTPVVDGAACFINKHATHERANVDFTPNVGNVG